MAIDIGVKRLVRTRLSRAVGLSVLSMGFVLIVVGMDDGMRASPSQVSQVSVFAPAYPYISADELAANADAIVIVRPTGEGNVHWNSSDGRAWSSTDRNRPAYIYDDQDVTVERTLSGSVSPGLLRIRKLGGTVDGFQMVFENDPSWNSGDTYLVFLREYETPTQTGTERYWTILWMDRGVFAKGIDGAWTNANAGLTIQAAELAALAAR